MTSKNTEVCLRAAIHWPFEKLQLRLFSIDFSRFLSDHRWRGRETGSLAGEQAVLSVSDCHCGWILSDDYRHSVGLLTL